MVGLFIPAVLSAGTITVDGVCTLTDAILSANADADVGSCVGASGPDTLVLDVDVLLSAADAVNSTLARGSFAGLPDVTTELTIEAGAGSVIERDPNLACGLGEPTAFRLLNVLGASGSLTLRGLTLRHGCGFAGGAVLFDFGPNGLIEDCTFTLNESHGPGFQFGGGALYLSRADVVTVVGSRFIQNRSNPGGDSGLPAFGGAIHADASSQILNVEDSVFRGNEALGGANSAGGGGNGRGGAIFGTSVSRGGITGSVFEGNRAVGGAGTGLGGAGSGGALDVRTAPMLTGTNAVFRGNRAIGGTGATEGGNATGGAIAGGAVDFVDVVLEDNRSVAGDGDLGGAAFGGAITLSEAYFERVSVSRNAALGGGGVDGVGGGALGGGLFIRVIADLLNVTLAQNTAQGGSATGAGGGGPASGGGVFIDFDNGSTFFRHTTIADNIAQGGEGLAGSGGGTGGGLRLEEGGATFESSLLSENATGSGDDLLIDNDCSAGAATISAGYNWVENPGTCDFTQGTDVVATFPELLTLGNHGCATPLADGRCPPTRPLALVSPALDQGSCTASGITVDARGLSRPWDFPAITDLDDGCDPGAYESRDQNGDGIEDGLQVFDDGFESGDTTAWTLTVP